jgi:hypothetical protein
MTLELAALSHFLRSSYILKRSSAGRLIGNRRIVCAILRSRPDPSHATYNQQIDKGSRDF